MKPFLKRYRLPLLSAAALTILYLFNRVTGMNALQMSATSLKEMLFFIPPIFILLGLLDTWVPKEIMVKYMGETSGWKGIVLAFLIGSAAAGPLYGAFPVAAVLMKKGVKFSNILIFIGAWSTTKIPMLLFEMSALGTTFAVTRLLIDIPGILIIAYLLEAILSNEKKAELYKKAEQL